jgi:tetratricopeptide (TPR) repeat protein
VAAQAVALANLLAGTSRFVEAEELYRQGCAMQAQALGPADEETLRTLWNLAQVLENEGKSDEAAAIRVRGTIEYLSRQGGRENMLRLRQIAYEHFRRGDYAVAEDIYRRMLESNFAEGGTACHLARVLFLSGREQEARQVVALAWKRRAGALPYEPPRNLFFQIVFALLDGRDPGPYLARLKHLLKEDNAHEEWTMGPLVESLQGRLSADHIDLLRALVAALSDPAGLAALDRFELWRDQTIAEYDDKAR